MIEDDFLQQDMIAQLSELDTIRQRHDVTALPALLPLYATQEVDQAVDEMLYHTIYSLLDGPELLDVLEHPAERVRLLAIRRAHADHPHEAWPILCRWLDKERNPEVLLELIRALGAYERPETGELLLPYLEHEEDAVAGLVVGILAGRGEFREILLDRARQGVVSVGDEVPCSIRLAMLVEGVARFADPAVIDFLVSQIHHRNPGLRRVILTALTGMGEAALPALSRCLNAGDKDEKIMAANVIGLLGERQGADILVALLQSGTPLASNIRFAVYEALGRISSLRSVIGLRDGLDEQDEMVLLAVIDSLERLVNPGVVKAVAAKMSQGGKQAERLAAAVVAAGASRLFAGLYQDAALGEMLIAACVRGGNEENIRGFQACLAGLNDERARADIKRLAQAQQAASGQRLVAADDSAAMLFFYKAVAAEMGLELITAKDGAEALQYLRQATDVDLLLTDMNMPNMTGIELATELRRMEQWRTLPILMATTESEAGQREIARQAGVDGFITKPFSKDRLRETLRSMLADSGDNAAG